MAVALAVGAGVTVGVGEAGGMVGLSVQVGTVCSWDIVTTCFVTCKPGVGVQVEAAGAPQPDNENASAAMMKALKLEWGFMILSSKTINSL